uniref:Secreted protein n=1 Tax=Anopheles atroparvus TaxID=41427 RepID=A0AAG5DNV6_ANOAO
MLSNWIVPVLVGLCCAVLLEASVRITNYTDEWDPKYLDVDLRVRRLDKTTAIDFDLDLKQELDKNVEYDVRLCKRTAGKYHQMMYTGKQQLCGKDLRRSRNLLDRYIASELVKHSNLTTRCPIRTGHYEVRNFEIDDRHLMMSVVPSGEFQIEVGVYHRGKEIKKNRWFVTAT